MPPSRPHLTWDNFRSKYLAVLSERNFRLFFIGYSCSLLGTAMTSVAVSFAVLDSGGTPLGLAVVSTANIVPMVAFMLGGGVLADRLGRRPVMLAADVARFAAQGVLAGLLLTAHPAVWLFAAAALAVGAGTAFFQPALSGLTVELAPLERVGDANALFGIARPAAQIAGPALAGILISAASPGTVIAADAATYGISAFALWLLRFPPEGRRKRPRSLRRELAEGWSEFTRHAWLWTSTVQFALFNLLTWGPYLVLGPVLARAYLGGARAWGFVLACYGIGAVAGGAAVLGRRPARPMLTASLATFGYAMPPLALALRMPLPVAAAGALLAGAGSAASGAISATVTQRHVPVEMLSRVGAITAVGSYAFGPVAFLAGGLAAGLAGARAVLAFGAAWSIFGTLAVLTVPSVRRVTWNRE